MKKNSGAVRVKSGGVLTSGFMVFKLARDAGWSWLDVLAPILIFAALTLAIYAIWITIIKFRK